MKIYVKTDNRNRIIDVNSAAFIVDKKDWTEIDEGEGDKYNLAQAHYFPQPIMDDNGIYRYKLVDGATVERTAEEMAADLAAIIPDELEPSVEDMMLDMLADHEYRIDMIELGI